MCHRVTVYSNRCLVNSKTSKASARMNQNESVPVAPLLPSHSVHFQYLLNLTLQPSANTHTHTSRMDELLSRQSLITTDLANARADLAAAEKNIARCNDKLSTLDDVERETSKRNELSDSGPVITVMFEGGSKGGKWWGEVSIGLGWSSRMKETALWDIRNLEIWEREVKDRIKDFEYEATFEVGPWC